MTGKLPPKMASICKALILVCLSSVVLLPLTAVKSQATGSRNDSIGYARQTICDLPLLPNGRYWSRKVQPSWNAGVVHGIAQTPYQFTVLSARVFIPFAIELVNPQSLAVFNPTTRSPPV